MGAKDDAPGQKRRHGKGRRSGDTGESGTGWHLVGSRAAGSMLIRAVLAWLIACHSRHMISGHSHRHGAHAYRYRHRKGDDEDKKRAGDRFRHRGKVTPAWGHFKRTRRMGARIGMSGSNSHRDKVKPEAEPDTFRIGPETCLKRTDSNLVLTRWHNAEYQPGPSEPRYER